jgi:hypothetical protein
MSDRTLMVYVGLGRANPELLRVAGDLALCLDARVIGIAAHQPSRGGVAQEVLLWRSFDQARDAAERVVASAEMEFREAMKARGRRIEWRAAVMCASVPDYLMREVGSADMLVMDVAAELFSFERRVNAFDLVRMLGRPVVLVPTIAGEFKYVRDHRGGTRAGLAVQPTYRSLPAMEWAGPMGIGPIVARAG